MSEIFATQLTAAATLALAGLALVTAGLAFFAWQKQSREVRDQAEMLRLQARPATSPQLQSWIGACCLAHGFPLASFNVKDFQDFAAHEGLDRPPPDVHWPTRLAESLRAEA